MQAGDKECICLCEEGREDRVYYSHISTANVRAWRGNDIRSMHPNLSCWEIIVITLIQTERQRWKVMVGHIIETQNRHIHTGKMCGYTAKRVLFYMCHLWLLWVAYFPLRLLLSLLTSELKGLWEYCFQVNAHDSRS